jgi:hypothetical protein
MPASIAAGAAGAACSADLFPGVPGGHRHRPGFRYRVLADLVREAEVNLSAGRFTSSRGRKPLWFPDWRRCCRKRRPSRHWERYY